MYPNGNGRPPYQPSMQQAPDRNNPRSGSQSSQGQSQPPSQGGSNQSLNANQFGQPAYRMSPAPVHRGSNFNLQAASQTGSTAQLLANQQSMPNLSGGSSPQPARRSPPAVRQNRNGSQGSYTPVPSNNQYVAMPQAQTVPIAASPAPYQGFAQPAYYQSASPAPGYYPGMPPYYQQPSVHPAYYYANVRPVYIHQYMLAANQNASLVKKEIPLNKDGNLVVDYPLSGDVLRDAKYRQGKEFTHLRYTPITCEANDLPKNFKLRQTEMNRSTKIALVMTMYNEDEVLFCKSMKAVFKNVKKFCDYYGPEWWRNFVVVIVSDGRGKINPRTLTVLGAMGCYADGLMQNAINDKPVHAHMFEFTAQVCANHDGEILTARDGMPPLQTIFLLKEKNAKKINSHRWFFNGICKILQPEVCMLLDVGTKPTPISFLELWKVFERDEHVGGSCGEIAAELGTGCNNLLNPLVAAQNFEYKMSNILDKPLESVFGFISVLPGAFSAYRFRAIQGAPLDAYFLGETMHGEANVYKANMYLAEDRILCFEIVAKKDESWLLKYVKNARAETDVPDRLPELISQRRRWLNGSFFAAVHALLNWGKIYTSGHNIFRKLFLTLQFFYNLANLIFSWFSVGNFYLAFYFLFAVTTDHYNADGKIDSRLVAADPFNVAGPIVNQVLKSVYVFLIVTTLVISLGNRPQGAQFYYHTIVIFFAVIMGLTLFLAVWSLIIGLGVVIKSGVNLTDVIAQGGGFRDMLIALAATYGAYILGSILHMDPWHCLTSMVQYMLLLPSYVNVLMIYAFCNISDTSWGTKGDNFVSTGEGAKVTTSASGEKVAELKLPSLDPKDVEIAYQGLLTQYKKNSINKVEDDRKRDAKTKQEDYFKQFRTNVVLFWMVTNAVLVYIFTTDNIVNAIFPTDSTSKKIRISPYLVFLFWAVAGLSAFRFVFSTLYVIGFWKYKLRYMFSSPSSTA